MLQEPKIMASSSSGSFSLDKLNSDQMKEAELKWGLFCSAVRSYKRESLVKPFPPEYKQSEDHKDFEALGRTLKGISNLRGLDMRSITEEQRDLIRWVMRKSDFQFMPVPDLKETFENLKLLAGDSTNPPCPNYIFKTIYPEQTMQKFQELRGDNGLIYGYHGSQLPNFYSILHHGLISNLNKTAAFGEGTYLSNELNVSLNWSPLSVPGAHLSLGKRLSCVAFCEVINDSSGVRHGTNSQSVSTASTLKDSVPEKYVIVQNDALVRVKYLLVYAEKHTSQPNIVLRRRMAHWIREHRYWIVLVGYFLLLVMIGLANSKDFHSYIRRFSHYWLTDYHRPTYDDT